MIKIPRGLLAHFNERHASEQGGGGTVEGGEGRGEGRVEKGRRGYYGAQQRLYGCMNGDCLGTALGLSAFGWALTCVELRSFSPDCIA